MDTRVPTRQNLLYLKAQYQVLERGLELLKSRREAMMREFFGLIEECTERRSLLSRLLVRAQRKLQRALALSEEELLSAVYALKREIALHIEIKNVWGVNVPVIEERALVRRLDALGVSPVGEKPGVLDVARDFEKVVDLLVRMTSKEIRFHRVGELIKEDARKINAIKEIILPSIDTGIKTIERILEDREREDIYRLKRFKKTFGGRRQKR